MRRHREHLARAADHRPAMADDLDAPVRMLHQPEPVGCDRAIGEHRRCRHLRPARSTSHALVAAAQMRDPAQHVVDRRDDRALAADVFYREDATPPFGVVACGGARGQGLVQRGHAGLDVEIARHRLGVVHA
ncbi:hypothetical protein D9M68_798090 [compost metagenome]